jgi:hypothetical protein
MIPNYLNREDGVRKKSIKQEKKIQRQLASGALWTHKGDLIDDECMYEVKGGKKQVVVTEKILKKIFEEAWKEGKKPVLIVEIGDKFKYIFKAEVFYENPKITF